VLVNPPNRFERKLEPLPAGVDIVVDAKGANVAVLFAAAQAELLRDFRPLAKALPRKPRCGSPGPSRLQESPLI